MLMESASLIILLLAWVKEQDVEIDIEFDSTNRASRNIFPIASLLQNNDGIDMFYQTYSDHLENSHSQWVTSDNLIL